MNRGTSDKDTLIQCSQFCPNSIGNSQFLLWPRFLHVLTLTTTQLHLTTFRGLPSLSILHKPTHSPNSSLLSTCTQSHTQALKSLLHRSSMVKP